MPDLLPTGIGPRTGQWDVDRRLYLPSEDDGLNKFRAAIAKIRSGSSTSRAKMACVGHSGFVYGAGGLDDLVRKIRRRYAQRTGDKVSSGLITIHQWNAGVSTPAGQDSRVTRTGTWSTNGSGAGGSANVWHWMASANAGDNILWQSDVPSTEVSFTYLDVAGTIGIEIDGVARPNIVTTGVAGFKTITYTGLPDAVHSLKASQVGALGIAILAPNFHSPSSVEFNNLGIYGSQAKDWTDFSSWYKAHAEVMATNPDAALIFLGGNELVSGVTTSTFASFLNTLISQYQSLGIDVALIGGYGGGGIADSTWLPFRNVLWNAADTYKTPLLDLYAAMGSYTVGNNNGMYADAYHLDTDGLEEPADLIARFLAHD